MDSAGEGHIGIIGRRLTAIKLGLAPY
jgi:hypothetical protein